jgi:hypothetical protein
MTAKFQKITASFCYMTPSQKNPENTQKTLQKSTEKPARKPKSNFIPQIY